jgi:hypothetical protein
MVVAHDDRHAGEVAHRAVAALDAQFFLERPPLDEQPMAARRHARPVLHLHVLHPFLEVVRGFVFRHVVQRVHLLRPHAAAGAHVDIPDANAGGFSRKVQALGELGAARNGGARRRDIEAHAYQRRAGHRTLALAAHVEPAQHAVFAGDADLAVEVAALFNDTEQVFMQRLAIDVGNALQETGQAERRLERRAAQQLVHLRVPLEPGVLQVERPDADAGRLGNRRESFVQAAVRGVGLARAGDVEDEADQPAGARAGAPHEFGARIDVTDRAVREQHAEHNAVRVRARGRFAECAVDPIMVVGKHVGGEFTAARRPKRGVAAEEGETLRVPQHLVVVEVVLPEADAGAMQRFFEIGTQARCKRVARRVESDDVQRAGAVGAYLDDVTIDGEPRWAAQRLRFARGTHDLTEECAPKRAPGRAVANVEQVARRGVGGQHHVAGGGENDACR